MAETIIEREGGRRQRDEGESGREEGGRREMKGWEKRDERKGGGE